MLCLLPWFEQACCPCCACHIAAKHLIAEGWDYHLESGNHFEASIPLHKVLDPTGGVMLAWDMNGQPLMHDHGYPVGGA